MTAQSGTSDAPRNGDLLLPYVLPYALYVLLSAIPESVLPVQANLALRIVCCGIALAWGWRWYVSLLGPRSANGSVLAGAVVGLLGTALWITLLYPIAPDAPAAWPLSAFLLRLVSAGLLVPIFEELLLRGLVFRLFLQWQEARATDIEKPLDFTLHERSINSVLPGAWSWTAILGSTVVFALGHEPHEWLACIGYGLLMCGLWIWRRDLLSCVVAHAVTNIALAAVVWHQRLWQLW